MFVPLERMEKSELATRWERCRQFLAAHAPKAGGLLAFSRLSLYYLTGSMNSGLFWLPASGEPVLMLRRGVERASMESPIGNIVTYRSYRDVPDLAREAGSPLSEVIAAEMTGLPWSLSASLTNHLADYAFVPGDFVLAKTKSVKSPWELNKMRLCGERHHRCLHELIPARVEPGMDERRISHIVWEVFFSQGHMGIMRMGGFGEEIFLGHVSAGNSGNYPSTFDGPLGLRGEHPAVPFMGYAGKVWKKGEPLSLDVGFQLEGYSTDKTQVLFAGTPETIPSEAASGHAFCMDVQAWLAENLKPGNIPSQLYEHCMNWAEREGFAEGFMALPPNKVKFLGHGIGITIDGYPVIAKGFDEPLLENQVLALEPKQGVPGLGMVGVENTFLVTPTGGQCLTGDVYDLVFVE